VYSSMLAYFNGLPSYAHSSYVELMKCCLVFVPVTTASWKSVYRQ